MCRPSGTSTANCMGVTMNVEAGFPSTVTRQRGCQFVLAMTAPARLICTSASKCPAGGSASLSRILPGAPDPATSVVLASPECPSSDISLRSKPCNATLAEKGLAMMTRKDIVAVIPTEEELGAKQGRGG